MGRERAEPSCSRNNGAVAAKLASRAASVRPGGWKGSTVRACRGRVGDWTSRCGYPRMAASVDGAWRLAQRQWLTALQMQSSPGRQVLTCRGERHAPATHVPDEVGQSLITGRHWLEAELPADVQVTFLPHGVGASGRRARQPAGGGGQGRVPGAWLSAVCRKPEIAGCHDRPCKHLHVTRVTWPLYALLDVLGRDRALNNHRRAAGHAAANSPTEAHGESDGSAVWALSSQASDAPRPVVLLFAWDGQVGPRLTKRLLLRGAELGRRGALSCANGVRRGGARGAGRPLVAGR